MAPVLLEDIEERIGFPCVVKPSKQGSTVGLTIVRAADDLEAAVELAAKYDDEVMIEQFIPAASSPCRCSATTRCPSARSSRREIFDYAAKYQPGGAEEIFPADLTGRRPSRCSGSR
jgi:D-alanine-D-alanine ligase